ncbi:SAM domain-containing protein SAMSN-1 [Sorex araneus]|uniref:SAM domain-containing protein SAMSN-1 n=1 Tax=Sorex araneus TaxID=42254 RepID=UPI002433892A|nr:SAM domain-containing protein SAMSN-1 [Sorex araneus]
MNLFCFSLEGSMESLYERVPEQQVNQENTSGSTDSPPFGNSGKAHNLFTAVPDFENTKSKRKSTWRSMSKNKVFEGKTVSQIFWQEPRNSENDSYSRRLCQQKDIDEDDFHLSNNIRTPQGKNPQDLPYQVTHESWSPFYSQRYVNTLSIIGTVSKIAIKPDGDPVESIRTLKRRQKLVQTKKAGVQSLNEMKSTFINLHDRDEAVTSCMKLVKIQEKKVSNPNTRMKGKMETKLDSISASLLGPHASNGYSMAEMLSHNEGEVHMWNSWKPFTEHPPWTCFDFQAAQVGPWYNSFHCSRHARLKTSCTDMDLQHYWRSSSFGNFDRFRKNSIAKSDNSTEVHEEELTNRSEEHKSSNNAGLGKKMRNISWTMKKKVAKKYIKALSEEKDEEDVEDTLPCRNSDPMIGTHMEKISLEASDSMDSIYSGHSSSSGFTSCSDGTSNRDSFRLDDNGLYTGPFRGRARVHTDFTPSPYDTDSLKIKKGDIIDIICKTPMGMWTGMLNNKVGNFKFIYVDVISDEEVTPRKTKAHRRSGTEKHKSLQEFLEMIQLQEYTSTLLLNGYETLEDLKDIKESHLIELDINNPEDRMRLLSATESLLDEETIQEQENESVPLSLSPGTSLNKSQLDDCPRDSGCYISSENSDNGKEDLESGNLSDMVQQITITEPSD